MAELEPGQSEDGSAPAATPALTVEEIQAMVSTEAQKIVDARIPGFQSVYEKQIASLKSENKQLREDPDGGLSSDSELEAQLAAAKRETDALRAGRLYPEAYPVFEAIFQAGTAEDQLDILNKFITGAKPAPDAAPQEATPETVAPLAPAAVDPNQPLPTAPTGGPDTMDQQRAASILSGLTTWPKFGR